LKGAVVRQDAGLSLIAKLVSALEHGIYQSRDGRSFAFTAELAEKRRQFAGAEKSLAAESDGTGIVLWPPDPITSQAEPRHHARPAISLSLPTNYSCRQAKG
jgi:hypothetical protein